MGIEIERKFLVSNDDWRPGAPGVIYRQGYLLAEGGLTVRVRRAGERGYLTIKGPAEGPARPEFEYEIPAADADAMLDGLVRGGVVDKIRYRRAYAGLLWEVDVFAGENAGLVVAEVELERVDQPVTLPSWAGEEVTDDGRYSNAALSRHPFRSWSRP